MATPPIVVGQQYFAGGANGYFVRVLDVHEETRSVKVHYDGYEAKYDAWLPMEKISVLPGKRDRKGRRAAEKDDAKPPPPPTSGGSRAPVLVPSNGDAVQVFDVHKGWRSGTVDVKTDRPAGLGSIVRYDDGDATVIQLPMDFDAAGDVRWPRKQGGELEGRRVIVPPKVFGQDNRDRQGGYAGTIKKSTGWRVTIFFPIDGKELAFPLDEARGWHLPAPSFTFLHLPSPATYHHLPPTITCPQPHHSQSPSVPCRRAAGSWRTGTAVQTLSGWPRPRSSRPWGGLAMSSSAVFLCR